MTLGAVATFRPPGRLQFGHAQRAWDDDGAEIVCQDPSIELQFGHAQRAWDDVVVIVCGLRKMRACFNSATPRGRGMTNRKSSKSQPASEASIRPRPEGVG